MSVVPSGIRGMISPIIKNDRPVAVIAKSNVEVNGSFNFSIYTKPDISSEEIEAVLLLYSIHLINSGATIDLGLLGGETKMLYAFSGRKPLTKAHLAMLPKNRRPSKLEVLAYYLFSLILVAVAFYVWRLKLIFLIIALLLIAGIYILVRAVGRYSKEKKMS